jgi:hypothetical protein
MLIGFYVDGKKSKKMTTLTYVFLFLGVLAMIVFFLVMFDEGLESKGSLKDSS